MPDRADPAVNSVPRVSLRAPPLSRTCESRLAVYLYGVVLRLANTDRNSIPDWCKLALEVGLEEEGGLCLKTRNRRGSHSANCL
jgi:hypothetical protein